MKKITIAFLMIIFVSPPSNASTSATISNVSSSKSWEEREYAKRQPKAEEWIRTLDGLATDAKQPQGIREVYHFLRYEVYIASPRNSAGVQKLTRLDFYEGQSAGILLILPEDNLTGEWKRYSTELKGAIARYSPGKLPAIIIRDVPISDSWKALNLAHESILCIEALERDEGLVHPDSPEWFIERAEMEDSAWGTISDSLLALKSDLRILVDEEKRRMEKEDTLARPSKERYSKRLALIFGESQSPFEEDLRNTALWIISAMEVIDKRNPDSLEAQSIRSLFFYKILVAGIL